ncbi:MAG: SH3 domain-containing protein [Chloroflexota bacterium]
MCHEVVNHEILSGIWTRLTNLTTDDLVAQINTQPGLQILCVPPSDNEFILELELDELADTTGYTALLTDDDTICDPSTALNFINSFGDENSTETSNLLDDVNTSTDDIVDLPEGSCLGTPATQFSAINVRELPSTGAQPIDAWDSSQDIPIVGTAMRGSWFHVNLPDGRTGFVNAGILNVASTCITANLPTVSVDEGLMLEMDAQAESNYDNTDTVSDVAIGEDGATVNTPHGTTNVNTDGVTVDVNNVDGSDDTTTVNVPLPETPVTLPVPPVGGNSNPLGVGG